ncbi:MAG: cysteine desulfurase-like protein [Anaerolineae bacterium]
MSSFVILPDVHTVRAQFPSLMRSFDGRAPIFLDNPGGTQVPQAVADAVSGYLLNTNANTNGAFRTSQMSDEVIAEAHRAAADLLGAADPREIVFGQNMTTLTFAISRSLGLGLKPGDEIIVTHLDHDANISPWLLLARDTGAVVRWVDFRHEDCTLDLDTLAAQLSPRTKIVAVGYASNAVGTINDVRRVVDMAHSVGALSYIDAVQYVPHGPTNVQALGTDFLVCSAYKFFGPHMGMLYGRADLLESLSPYKVRPADDTLPTRFETGTQNHEGQAGTLAAINYLASLANGGDASESRRSRLVRGMQGIQAYEQRLSERLICGLLAIPGVTIYGIADVSRFDERVPTVSITMYGTTPLAIAEALAQREIYVWEGNFYALSVTTQLGLEPTGLLRIGAAHYNTVEEIDALLNALEEIRSDIRRVS